ncbi:MAG: alkaline phosphatase D family protein [Acidobacteria bacterium]|nr:alkaline phosphatase D family protein [Acidobacteriota bacterium]
MNDDVSRRKFLQLAAAFGAVAAFGGDVFAAPALPWRERRDLYPEGVASGDPAPDSVLLWTRRPFPDGRASAKLTVQVASDEAFKKVVATAPVTVSPAADWTCRVLVGGLAARRVYWYRFTDENGDGSRIGRTITAPREDDARPVKFAFVSCQNANDGAQHAYRRMIYEDERADPADRLGFVLHLGDFIYELVWYPEDRPQGMYDRKIRDLVRYANGQKVSDFHIPTTVDDYRAVYRAYLHDPDLQDARAHFPFVSMWDNHEFSWLGWQSLQKFNGKTFPAQTRKVAANQAWFEFLPARVAKPSAGLATFDPPPVKDVAIERFDENGLGQEPNNLAALASLKGYRAFRYGRNVDLIITDQHSYRSEEPSDREEAAAFQNPDFPEMIPQEAMEILDAGRTYNGGRPPATIRYGDKDVPNFRRNDPPQTILGAEQKAWFFDRLRHSKATWKIWGCSLGTLDWRADPQNLPAGVGKPWPGAGYAAFGGGDHSTAYVERAEIYDLVAKSGITGFATVAGDRHSFWAGLAAKALPPAPFEPVGVAFITGSISAPGLVEAFEHRFPKDHALRPLFLMDLPGEARPEPAVNLLLQHGVRSCLEFQRTGDRAQAEKLSNPALSPHLSFVDMGGHGYATVRMTSTAIESEFVCIPRPVERITTADGGPLRYRVKHRARLWGKGERPKLERSS